MTTPTTRVVTWGDLAALPVAPDSADLLARDLALQGVWKAFSKQIGTPKRAKAINGPRALRLLLGLTLQQMADLLARYHPRSRHYGRAALSVWERPERGEQLPPHYAPTAETRQAWRALVCDLVQVASEGRLRASVTIGARSWRVRVYARCRDCGREFSPRDARQRRCRRCAK